MCNDFSNVSNYFFDIYFGFKPIRLNEPKNINAEFI